MQGGSPVVKMWGDPITENITLNNTEVWSIFNFTMDAHPIHLHQVQFEVISRQALATDATGAIITPVALAGPPIRRERWESGTKDTVIAYPGQVTRIKAHFDLLGLYVWHCHIIDHEDNEMMRPFQVVP